MRNRFTARGHFRALLLFKSRRKLHTRVRRTRRALKYCNGKAFGFRFGFGFVLACVLACVGIHG